MSIRDCSWLSGLLFLLVVSGCGGNGRLNVKGRVLKNGAAFKTVEPDFVRVIFFPVTTDGRPPKNTYLANFDKDDGTFEAVGPDGGGVPPGKYRISVELNRKRKDMLKGAFDGDHSPFVFDVDAGTKELVLDLDKPPTK
jgi:hypothetical protein